MCSTFYQSNNVLVATRFSPTAFLLMYVKSLLNSWVTKVLEQHGLWQVVWVVLLLKCLTY